jgi:hypothetical protein
MRVEVATEYETVVARLKTKLEPECAIGLDWVHPRREQLDGVVTGRFAPN